MVCAANHAINRALVASGAWLKLVDAGDYSASYKAASSLFKAHVSSADWDRRVGAARKPLGALVSRKLSSTRYATSLPDAPDGRYVVITYQSSFTNKKSAIETVTLMLDKNNRWRASGYYIR